MTSSQPKTNFKARKWGPNTWNNPTGLEIISIKRFCKNEKAKYFGQMEVGENGTKHLQFCISFKNPRHFNSLKKQFPKVHWEKARNWKNVVKYCTKKETRLYTDAELFRLWHDCMYKHMIDYGLSINESMDVANTFIKMLTDAVG